MDALGAHEIIVDVDDVEGDEPGQHGDRDDDPGIELQHQQNHVEEGAHQGLRFGAYGRAGLALRQLVGKRVKSGFRSPFKGFD